MPRHWRATAPSGRPSRGRTRRPGSRSPCSKNLIDSSLSLPFAWRSWTAALIAVEEGGRRERQAPVDVAGLLGEERRRVELLQLGAVLDRGEADRLAAQERVDLAARRRPARPGDSVLNVTIFGSSTSQSSVSPGSSSVRRRYSSWVQPAHAPICLPDSSVRLRDRGVRGDEEVRRRRVVGLGHVERFIRSDGERARAPGDVEPVAPAAGDHRVERRRRRSTARRRARRRRACRSRRRSRRPRGPSAGSGRTSSRPSGSRRRP